MKKLMILPFIAGGLLLAGCGGKSIKANDDTLETEEAVAADPAEKARMDSIEKARTDSIAQAEETERIKEEKLSQGIVGEAVLHNGVKITFKKGNSYKTSGGDYGNWKKRGEGISYLPSESSVYYTLLNGYEYTGYYDPKTNTLTYEGTNSDGDLDDVTVKVSKSKKSKLRSFDWYE